MLVLSVLALLAGRMLLDAGLDMGLGKTAARRGAALLDKVKSEEARRLAASSSSPASSALTFSVVTSTTLSVGWTSAGAGAQYQTQVSTDDFATVVASSQTLNVFASFTALTPNTTYTLRLQLAGASDFLSSASTITLANLPAAGVVSGVFVSSLTAAWAANGNPAGTSYVAEASADAFASVAASSQTLNTSATFVGLTTNTAYALRLKAANSAGTPTAYTALGSTATCAAVPSMAAATGVGETGLTANWLANGNPAGTSYAVELSTDAFATMVASSQTLNTSATFTGLTPATAYAMRVRVLGVGGTWTAYADLDPVTTNAATGLPGFAAVGGVNISSLTANWTPGSNPGGTQYLAQVSTDAFATIAQSSQTLNTSATFVGLTTNTAYALRVGVAGAGTYTALGSTTTLAAQPGASTTAPSISSTTLTARWISRGNPAGTWYAAELSTDAFATLVRSSQTLNVSASFVGLSSNTLYNARVLARNSAGTPTPYLTLASTRTLASAPGIAAPSGVTESAITANWTANGNPAGTSYTAQISTNAFSRLTASSITLNAWATFTGLSPNRRYDLQVLAPNAVGSPITVSLGSTVTLAAVPGAITFTDLCGTGFTVNWSTSGNLAYTLYEVHLSTDNFATLVSSAQTREAWASFVGLTQNTTYDAKVRAINLSGIPTAYNTTTQATTNSAPPGITLSLVAARQGGVAPLAVFFDASGTKDLATSRPFHDLEYHWNFGDPAGSPVGGATWATGSRPGEMSRNISTGPVAAHVFETPGTYTVTLEAIDGAASASGSVQITVDDPNAVFAGTMTLCFSNGGGFTGCPSGAQQISNSSDFVTVIASATTGKRLLLERGGVWNEVNTPVITASGPGMVGAYGSGAKPFVRKMQAGGMLQFSSYQTPTFRDWRVMDLEFDGMDRWTVGGIGTSGGMTQVTLLRMTMRNMQTGFGISHELPNWWNNTGSSGHTIDQLAVVDSEVFPGANTQNPGYNSGNRVAFMGNHFDGGGILEIHDEFGNLVYENGSPRMGSHTTRWPFLAKAVLSFNDFIRAGGSRLAIKLHGPTWFNGVPGSTTDKSLFSEAMSGDGSSRQVLISDNRFQDAYSPQTIVLGPQHAAADERVRDVILERNVHIAGVYSYVAQILRASEITSRNNIFVSTFTTANPIAFLIEVDDVGLPQPHSMPMPHDIRVYNNTQYSAYNWVNSFAMVQVRDTRVTNISLKNNIAYAPSAPLTYFYNNAYPTQGFTAAGNSTNAQVKNTVPFTVTPPWLPADFRPMGYPVGAGVSVPVFSDFYGNPRPQGAMDMGAIEVP